MKKRFNTRTLVICSLLIALQIVLSRLISLESGYMKITLGFFPIAVASMVLGPLYGGIVGALADFLGMLIFSRGNVYFFPFTITEFLYGIGFGLILYRKNISILKISFFTILQYLLLSIILNSFWNYLYYILIVGTHKGYWVILWSRLATASINLPMQVIGTNLIYRYLKAPLEKIVTKN